MQFNNFLANCQNDDVFNYQEKLFKIGEIKQTIVQAFIALIPKTLNQHLAQKHNIYIDCQRTIEIDGQRKVVAAKDVFFEEGVDFSVLKAGSPGWQKENLKLT
jgi:hypothetical protein